MGKILNSAIPRVHGSIPQSQSHYLLTIRSCTAWWKRRPASCRRTVFCSVYQGPRLSALWQCVRMNLLVCNDWLSSCLLHMHLCGWPRWQISWSWNIEASRRCLDFERPRNCSCLPLNVAKESTSCSSCFCKIPFIYCFGRKLYK